MPRFQRLDGLHEGTALRAQPTATALNIFPTDLHNSADRSVCLQGGTQALSQGCKLGTDPYARLRVCRHNLAAGWGHSAASSLHPDRFLAMYLIVQVTVIQ